MTKIPILTFAIATLTCSMPADAGSLLATGGVYGGNTQRLAYCYIFNGSGGDITFLSTKILDQYGNNVTSPINKGQCGWYGLTLGANRTCLIAAQVGPSSTYACKISIAEAKAAIRGTFDLRDINDKVLISSPLR